ncbi:MAG: restriction endonuclease subunit S [Ruminiclostridium sp.]|nr:restriction endonuclease subunit S [Ruminiclostridium sp.]
MRAILGDLITPAKVIRCEDGSYPVLSMTMHDGIVLQSERFKKSLASADQSNYKVVKRGQLVVGFPIDEGVLYIQDAVDEGIMSPAYAVWDVDDRKVNRKYLELALHSDSAMQYYGSKLRGTTARRRSIPANELLALEFLLPSMQVQEQAVKALGKVNRLISLRQQQLAKLDELVKERFVELFGDPMTNSNGYVLKKYGDLFELNAGGTPSKQKPEYWDDGTISWIGSNMCQNTVIYENDGNYITEEGLKHSSARMFPVDTVLIALVGATIGKTALLKFETTTNQNVLGVRGIRESGYTPEFIFYYTQGLYQKFLNIGDGGFAMASKGFISELPVPIVDLTLQEQFAAFVEQTDKSKLTVQQSLDKLEVLKKSLMQQYFG